MTNGQTAAAGERSVLWDGRPRDPERDGWHWIKAGSLTPECMLWCAKTSEWERFGGWLGAEFAASGWEYLGPCEPPSAIAERDAEIQRLRALLLFNAGCRGADLR